MGLAVFQRRSPTTLKLDAWRDPRMRTLDEKGRREPTGPCEVTWTAAVGETESVTWSKTDSARVRTHQEPAPTEFSRPWSELRVPGVRWPLFAWYGVDRLGRLRDRRRKVERHMGPLGSLRLRARPEPVDEAPLLQWLKDEIRSET